MKASALPGKIVIVTGLRKIPESCSKCKYYDSMGGHGGRRNDGICIARAYPYTTRRINVSKERLTTCPLVMGGEEQNPQKCKSKPQKP